MDRPIADWLDPKACPAEKPPRAAMGERTRALHDAVDAAARTMGVRTLNPERPTIQRDLLGSPEVVAWQEAKLAFVMRGDGAWSELPHLYARYGTPGTARLIAALRELEGARAAFVTDCGMQAFALVADCVLTPGSHAVVLRQVYNKTKTFLQHSAKRVGATVTVVDDGDVAAVGAAVTPETTLVFAETFTNPLVRAQDVPGLVAAVRGAGARKARLVIDSTIASPWAFHRPLLSQGVSVVIGSLTKSLGGRDAGLGGYIATDDAELGNQVMDLIAMRGGILDEERATRVVDGLAEAERLHARRCESATRVARFLSTHPRIERVFHPSLPDHPDAAVIARDYRRHGSIVAFRVREADELRHRHIADVVASCGMARYALSFDGLVSKLNHHRTVSEYFTPDDVVRRAGIERLIRLAVGIEDADDVIACLNWALHHEATVDEAALDAWRTTRAAELAPA